MSLPDNELEFYRPGVGIVLLNRDGLVFVGRRADMPAGIAAWQMPQGGIDPGETPREAALRELGEEVGTDKATILAESAGWLTYDLPEELRQKLWRGRWRGQSQKWFALAFTGRDTDIDIAAHGEEFDAWKWVSAGELPDLIVPFKREVYRMVLKEFADLISPANR